MANQSIEEELMWALKNKDLDKLKEIAGTFPLHTVQPLTSEDNISAILQYKFPPIGQLKYYGKNITGTTWRIRQSAEALVGNLQDKDVVTQLMKNGRHPMCIAADFGQVEVLQFLVNHGADVNVVDRLDMTPLLCAVYESHKDCIKFLLSKGAKKVSPDGKSYADSAESNEIKDMLK